MSHTWQMSKNPNKCIAIVRISQFMQDRNALKGAFRSLKFRGTMKLRGDYQIKTNLAEILNSSEKSKCEKL